MKATILTIGTELLFGSITNTNCQFLSQQLNDISVDVIRHITVGDNEERLMKALEESYTDSDVVITTGGIGPTKDDLTKETIAKFFNLDFFEDKKELQRITEWFAAQGKEMTDNNKKQALFPVGSEILPNPYGTACGFYYSDGKRDIYVLPGPPRELVPMYYDYVKPKLQKNKDGFLFFKQIRTIGITEARLEMKLMDLIDNQTDPTIATYSKPFESMIRVASKRPTLQEAKDAVEEIMVQVRKRVGEFIYSEDNEELLEVVVAKMKAKGYKLACAEAMTGGMFSKMITDMPGTSSVLDRSIVTYSEISKMFELDVMPDVMERYGEVSSITVTEMARGLAIHSECSTCIAVTGYAGPTAADNKPVGLFYIALIHNGELEVKEFHSTLKTRDDIRKFACMEMAKMLYYKLNYS